MIAELKKQGGRADLAAVMYKHMAEAKKMAIDCASKLAPYESPRLEAIEVKQKTVTKFVIESPTAIKDQSQWLSNTQRELKLIKKLKRDAQDIEVISDAS